MAVLSSAPFQCIAHARSSFPKSSDFFSKSSSQLLLRKLHLPPISATAEREVYQPFRPPPTIIPALENLSVQDQLQILSERRGLWFDYAVHVPSLIRAGYAPSMIDEATGMTGVEQNKIVVASHVRSSLQTSGMEDDKLAYFDIGGADLLYELRILSAAQRKSAAELVLERKMDTKECRELARAMKDYERRKREEGWDSFSFIPGDCLAFACYRQSKEFKNETDRENILKKGLEYAVSEKARAKISAFLEKGEEEIHVQKPDPRLQVVRLSPSEDGTTSMPHVLPVVDPIVQELQAAPSVSIRKGPFHIQHSETAWKSWIALPGWEPLTNAVAPVAISFPNATSLPWKPKNRKELDEPVVVVADKHFTDLHANTYFMVEGEGGKLGLQLGNVVAQTGTKVFGKVILALRPPVPLSDEIELIDD